MVEKLWGKKEVNDMFLSRFCMVKQYPAQRYSHKVSNLLVKFLTYGNIILEILHFKTIAVPLVVWL